MLLKLGLNKMNFVIVIIVVICMVRVTVLCLKKYVIDVVGKITLRRNADKVQTQAGLVDIRVSIPNLIRII